MTKLVRVWNRAATLDPLAGAEDLLARVRPTQLAARADRTWYRITNQAGPDTAEVYIYDEIGFWGCTAADFVEELRGITAPRIDLHLNTPGGDVFDGIAIRNVLAGHPAQVTVYVDALAASIGSVIAMAGDRIVMGRNSQMMIHDASGFCIGNAADMAEMQGLLDRVSDNIAAVYADRAGGEMDGWRGLMRAETWYNADEAVAAGLADEVAPGVDRQAQQAAAGWDLTVFAHAGRAYAPAPRIAARVGGVTGARAVEPDDRELVVTDLQAHLDDGGGSEDHADQQPTDVAEIPLPGYPQPEAEPGPEADPVPAPTEEPDQPAAAEPLVDDWTALVAHLTQPAAPDPDAAFDALKGGLL